MFVPLKEADSVKWSEYSLILPAVSIGNVGQLATDLVISALSPSLIGFFHDASILPVVGNDAFDHNQSGKLNLSVEVYKSEEPRLIIIQKRSPVCKGYQSSYCKKLLEWIKECGFQRVVMLSSVSATDRIDSQIKGSPLRYLTSSPVKDNKFEQLLWVPFEKKLYGFSNEDEGVYSMPGGGITRRFFEACCQEKVNLTVLVTFCSEGENIADGVQLFLYLNQWINIVDKDKVEAKFAGKPSDFRIPSSWSLMFGSPILHDFIF
ncbi:proteasome assembly chaperone 2 [Exaiptasia diaphana]|uniref:Proteasome assembly chaperone 2 n=1 Tax=Exaiptasia diaphana TaxID=2652724 RepID=A0A913XV53_EXADI|nr:proteasome assembly chaperone 2 [Exaiptasia diaphana]KXJ24306.1 Proteasome assembly chaperone 2 [Exaiptasia diaphana]